MRQALAGSSRACDQGRSQEVVDSVEEGTAENGSRSEERRAEGSLDQVDRHHRHMEGALKVHVEMESARQRH
jgi:hypothetical protein